MSCARWLAHGIEVVTPVEAREPLKTIFAQENKADAEARWQVVADALREKQAKLGTLMDASRADVLAYMDFPANTGPRSRQQTRSSG